MLLEIDRKLNNLKIPGVMYSINGLDWVVRVSTENMQRASVVVEYHRGIGVRIEYRELLPVEKEFCERFNVLISRRGK